MRGALGQATAMPIRLETFVGAALHPHLPALARLRVEVFRDWPYLYDGNLNAERVDTGPIATSAGAALVAAFDGDDVVGCSTCLPLADESEYMTAPFAAAGLNPAHFCYFSESLLRPAYRGQGIGVAFFERREAQARALAGVTIAAFCAVRRPPDHPLRPADARPLDEFWRHRGFVPLPEVVVRMRWKQVDTEDRVDNALDVWAKRL